MSKCQRLLPLPAMVWVLKLDFKFHAFQYPINPCSTDVCLPQPLGGDRVPGIVQAIIYRKEANATAIPK